MGYYNTCQHLVQSYTLKCKNMSQIPGKISSVVYLPFYFKSSTVEMASSSIERWAQPLHWYLSIIFEDYSMIIWSLFVLICPWIFIISCDYLMIILNHVPLYDDYLVLNDSEIYHIYIYIWNKPNIAINKIITNNQTKKFKDKYYQSSL